MKNIFLILSLLLCCSLVRAQDLRSFKESLMVQDSLFGSKALVVEHNNLDSILSALSNRIQVDKVNGFRVSIFVDNSQTARSSAEDIKLEFEDKFPYVCAYLNYKSPDFIVTVGNCSTMDEATVLKGRVKGSFKRAFIVRESIEIDSLYNVPYIEELFFDSLVEPEESLSKL